MSIKKLIYAQRSRRSKIEFQGQQKSLSQSCSPAAAVLLYLTINQFCQKQRESFPKKPTITNILRYICLRQLETVSQYYDYNNRAATVVRHSSEKGAIIILANFFFNLNSHFNLYNDVFERKNDFEGQMGKLVF
jgi:hypothetical protein